MLPTRCINVESNRFFLRLLWALPPSPSVLNHWTNSPRHFLTWSIFLITLRGEGGGGGGGGGGGVHTWRYALGWLLAIRWYYLQNWNEIFSVFSCWYLFSLWLWLAPPHMLPAWCSFWKLNATFISIFRTIPYQKFSSNRKKISFNTTEIRAIAMSGVLPNVMALVCPIGFIQCNHEYERKRKIKTNKLWIRT